MPGVVFPSLATWGVESSCIAFLYTFLVFTNIIKKIKFLILLSITLCKRSEFSIILRKRSDIKKIEIDKVNPDDHILFIFM